MGRPAKRSRLEVLGAGSLVKDTATVTGKAASGTAKAAAVAGGVGLAVGAGVAGTVTALSKGHDGKDQGKGKGSGQARARSLRPSAPALTPITPSPEPKPLDLHGSPAPEPSKAGASLAPHDPTRQPRRLQVRSPFPFLLRNQGQRPHPRPTRVESVSPPAGLPAIHAEPDPGPVKNASPEPQIPGQGPSVTSPRDQPRPVNRHRGGRAASPGRTGQAGLGADQALGG